MEFLHRRSQWTFRRPPSSITPCGGDLSHVAPGTSHWKNAHRCSWQCQENKLHLVHKHKAEELKVQELREQEAYYHKLHPPKIKNLTFVSASDNKKKRCLCNIKKKAPRNCFLVAKVQSEETKKRQRSHRFFRNRRNGFHTVALQIKPSFISLRAPRHL